MFVILYPQSKIVNKFKTIDYSEGTGEKQVFDHLTGRLAPVTHTIEGGDQLLQLFRCHDIFYTVIATEKLDASDRVAFQQFPLHRKVKCLAKKLPMMITRRCCQS